MTCRLHAVSLLLATATTALLPACAGSNRAQQLAAERPAFVRVVSRHASAPARREGCRVTFAAQAPGAGQRLRELADLEVSGPRLDRAQAEKLLADKACALGASTLAITDEDYGSSGERGSVEATAYGFHSPVQILLSGLEVDADAKPLSCRILYFRTQRPEAPYDEIAGLNLNVKAAPTVLGMTATTSQAHMLDELRQAACHLGADAIVLSTEDYDVPTIGSRVSGTAILFRENRERRPAPGSQEL